MKKGHYTYLIEQPFGGRGRAYQAVCEKCGVLVHINDRAAAEKEARLHGELISETPLDPVPATPMTADEVADAAHLARERQRHIEESLR